MSFRGCRIGDAELRPWRRRGPFPDWGGLWLILALSLAVTSGVLAVAGVRIAAARSPLYHLRSEVVQKGGIYAGLPATF